VQSSGEEGYVDALQRKDAFPRDRIWILTSIKWGGLLYGAVPQTVSWKQEVDATDKKTIFLSYATGWDHGRSRIEAVIGTGEGQKKVVQYETCLLADTDAYNITKHIIKQITASTCPNKSTMCV